MQGISTSTKTAIIINPYQAGGGDKALGRKVNECFKNNGYKTKVVSIYIYPDVRDQVMFLADKEIATRHCIIINVAKQTMDFIDKDNDNATLFNNSLIAIAPLNKNKFYCIPEVIKLLQDHYRFKKNNLLIIDEFGSSIEDKQFNKEGKLPYEFFKKQLGFKSITDRSLGFDASKQQIGYFPVDNTKLEQIDKNYQHNIRLLLDGFNFDLTVKDILLFGYLSSDYFKGHISLIYNSLIELESLEKAKSATSINYVLLFRENMPLCSISTLINLFTGRDQIKQYSIKEYNINFYLCDNDNCIIAEKNDTKGYYSFDISANNLEDNARIMLLYKHKSKIKNPQQLNIFFI